MTQRNSITEVYENGVKIWSRYGDPREFRVMSDVIKWLPEDARERVTEIFCDTKACASYAVAVKRGSSMRFVAALLDYTDLALKAIQGGHNGISAYENKVISGSCLGDVDPDWAEEAL